MEFDFFRCIPRAVFDTATLTGSYQPLNGTGFQRAIKLLKIYNGGTNGVDISYDGEVDHEYFPAGMTLILDLQTNHECNTSYGAGTKVGAQGQVIYGKGTAGTGSLYIVGYY